MKESLARIATLRRSDAPEDKAEGEDIVKDIEARLIKRRSRGEIGANGQLCLYQSGWTEVRSYRYEGL